MEDAGEGTQRKDVTNNLLQKPVNVSRKRHTRRGLHKDKKRRRGRGHVLERQTKREGRGDDRNLEVFWSKKENCCRIATGGEDQKYVFFSGGRKGIGGLRALRPQQRVEFGRRERRHDLLPQLAGMKKDQAERVVP